MVGMDVTSSLTTILQLIISTVCGGVFLHFMRMTLLLTGCPSRQIYQCFKTILLFSTFPHIRYALCAVTIFDAPAFGLDDDREDAGPDVADDDDDGDNDGQCQEPEHQRRHRCPDDESEAIHSQIGGAVQV